MATLDHTDVVILAGGLGTRLRPVLPDRQKVLVEVAGQPFLGHPIEFVQTNGAKRLILALGYQADQVESFVRARRWEGFELIPSVEPVPLGTGGALRFALPLIRSDTVLVLNGDSFAAADLGSFLKFHLARRALISLLLVPMKGRGRYGVAEAGENGAVARFVEKPSNLNADGYINAGAYFFSRGTIASIESEKALSLEQEVFPRHCSSGLYAMKQDVPFIDIGSPESWRGAGAFFASLQNRGHRSDH